MTATRDADQPDAVGSHFELTGARLKPTRGIIDVGKRGRIAGDRRHAKIERCHDNTASYQRLIEHRVGRAVMVAPGAAMEVNQQRTWPITSRLEQAQDQRAAAVAQVFDVVNRELVRKRWCGLCSCAGGWHDGVLRVAS